MSFAKLQEALVKDVEDRIEELEKKHQQDFLAEEARIKENAQAAEEIIIREAELRGEQDAKRLHQTGQLKARADILRAKQEELDVTLEEVVKKIVTQDEAATRTLLTALFDLLPSTSGEVMPGEHHQASVTALAAERGITVREEALPGEGGFIYHDSSSDIDLTIRHLVKQLFDRRRAEVAAILFNS